MGSSSQLLSPIQLSDIMYTTPVTLPAVHYAATEQVDGNKMLETV